jgi:hypothetical protein
MLSEAFAKRISENQRPGHEWEGAKVKACSLIHQQLVGINLTGARWIDRICGIG